MFLKDYIKPGSSPGFVFYNGDEIGDLGARHAVCAELRQQRHAYEPGRPAGGAGGGHPRHRTGHHRLRLRRPHHRLSLRLRLGSKIH